MTAWYDFCKNKLNFNYQNPTKATLLAFLTFRYKNGASYGTLNTDRSAISIISHSKIGEDLEVSRFLKAVFRLNPPKARYTFTWDTTIVLDYLRTLSVSSNDNLCKISKKLVMLLALATAQRAQTLARININNILMTDLGITIIVDEILKTSSHNKPHQVLKFPTFIEDKELCIVTCLKDYLEITANIRNNEKQLFISINKPHRAISSQTISRWIKEVLSDSGINTQIFKGHSTRSASTSKAKDLGISLETIRKTAGWSEGSSSFAKFYNKPILENNENFVNAVFNRS